MQKPRAFHRHSSRAGFLDSQSIAGVMYCMFYATEMLSPAAVLPEHDHTVWF
jgi:hypothetical protein